MPWVDTKQHTFTAKVNMPQGSRFRVVTGSTTDPIEIELAPANARGHGHVLVDATEGEVVAGRMNNGDGTVEAIAAKAIPAGTELFAATNGQVGDTNTNAELKAVSLEAAESQGQIIEIMYY